MQRKAKQISDYKVAENMSPNCGQGACGLQTGQEIGCREARRRLQRTVNHVEWWGCRNRFECRDVATGQAKIFFLSGPYCY